MRKAKSRKMDKKVRAKANIEYKKNKQQAKQDRDKKYKKWENLPIEEWTDARKKRMTVISR